MDFFWLCYHSNLLDCLLLMISSSSNELEIKKLILVSKTEDVSLRRSSFDLGVGVTAPPPVCEMRSGRSHAHPYFDRAEANSSPLTPPPLIEASYLKNKECFLKHLVLVLHLTLLLFAILGGVTGSRYLQYNEETCLQRVSCPSESSNHGCVSVKNKTGVFWTGNVESSLPDYDLPRPCWTNGRAVTYLNPKEVMLWCLVALGVLVTAYWTYAGILYCCVYTEVNPFQEDIARLYMMDFSIKRLLYKSMAVGFCVWMVCMFIILVKYDSPYREVQCTNYVVQNDQENWAHWIDEQGKHGDLVIAWPSARWNTFPQRCWISQDVITFNNPKAFYAYTSLGLLFFVACFGTALICYELCPCKRTTLSTNHSPPENNA